MPIPQRLPIVDSDDGTWGDIILQYLTKEHYDTGSDNAANGGHKTVTIRAGTAAAGTAPLKLTSGTLLSTPEAGAIEFNTNRLYLTQTTSSTRKVLAAFDDTSGATGDIYYRDSSGSFTRLGIGSTNDVLKINSGLPSWGAQSGGDASTNTSSSVDSEIALFSGTGGKTLKRATGTGLATLTGGVLGAVTAPSGTVVGTTDTQTLSNKTVTFATSTKTSNYTMANGDVVVFADATSGNVTVTLPTASSNTGYRCYIKRIDGSANSCSVTRSGSDTIDGATSVSLSQQYMSLTVVSNGSAWYII